MKKVILLIIGLTFLILSCNKNEKETDDLLYNATVLGKGLDCGNSFLIKFNDDVIGLSENNSDNTFYEINLSEEYKIEGKKIKVEFREPEQGELMVCTTMGIGYPQVFIVKVE
ncbi:MAG: hypothetical protein KAT68_02015 [Bacteroidales bacterium]|nr:hypothetical protein [Bacteroidales bacterium]